MAVVKVENLSLGYGKNPVATGISFAVGKGQLVGIVGSNGAGKSTLLKTLRGLLPKIEGNISFFDRDLASYKEVELAQSIAYLQQQVQLDFAYTGEDLVLAGRYPYHKWWQGESKEDKELVQACLEYTGTLPLAQRPVNQLSGGQKQRLLLAKVLAQQTPILFLDEPTTGLDMVYQEEFFRFARELAQMGKTVLMVVHELPLAANYCQRILLLGKGRLLADGTPQAVFTDELLTAAYDAQVRACWHDNNKLELTTISQAKEERHALLQEICGGLK